MDGANPAVAAAFDSRDKDWIVGGVAQSVAQAHDGATDALLEIHKDARGPECLTKFLARDHFPGTSQQQGERSKGKVLETDLDAVPPQLARTQIRLEYPEANESCRRRRRNHKE